MESKNVTLDLSKIPVPNKELVLYVLALLLAAIVIGISDALTIRDWFTFYLVTTAVYILSRGIAKAHNVKD